MRKLFLIFVFILPLSLLAQQQQMDIELFQEYEEELVDLGQQILDEKYEFERKKANDKFVELFRDALSIDQSFFYPFDSIPNIGIVTSSNKSFRILTWAVMMDNGTYKYYGFTQGYKKSRKEYIVYELYDNSDSIKDPENQLLKYDNWYGAVYYQLVETKNANTKSSRSTYYSLLGWDGDNTYTNSKVIEVVRFTSTGRPTFGYPLFRKYTNRKAKRVIFKYSSYATMSLKFEEQLFDVNYKTKKKRRKNKRNLIARKQKIKMTPMIVFDYLVPTDPNFKGMYQYYVPSMSYDGFIWNRNKWYYFNDIDARNEEIKDAVHEKGPKDDNKNQIILYSPN